MFIWYHIVYPSDGSYYYLLHFLAHVVDKHDDDDDFPAVITRCDDAENYETNAFYGCSWASKLSFVVQKHELILCARF